MSFRYCLINPYEAECIRQGKNISCRNHGHISRSEVLRLTGGGKHRPWLEEDQQARRSQQIAFNYHPIADWAMMPDGSESNRHVVLRQAKEWVQRNGCMQLIAIGSRGRSTGNRFKIHLRPPRPPKCKIIKG